jgi:hypothetical protein
MLEIHSNSAAVHVAAFQEPESYAYPPIAGPSESHGTEVGPIQFWGCICPKLECIIGSLHVDPIVGTGEPDCECGCERTKFSCMPPTGERVDIDDMVDIVESGVWIVFRS